MQARGRKDSPRMTNIQSAVTTIPAPWGDLLAQSTDTLIGFFQQESLDAQALAKARIATSVLSNVTRHEATERARDAMRVAVYRQISKNREEFAEFVKISMPQLKMLPER